MKMTGGQALARQLEAEGITEVFGIPGVQLDWATDGLRQLGNRVQHALRAYTPKEQKAVALAAETYRTNPKLNVARAVQELQVGEALVSFLQADGSPAVVERAFIVPPASQFGPADAAEVHRAVTSSRLYGRYANPVDRSSAYELLQQKAAESAAAAAAAAAQAAAAPAKAGPAPKAKPSEMQKMAGAVASSAMHAIGSQIGREIMRGGLGGLFGGSRRRR